MRVDSNLESAGAAGTVGNVCLDVQNSEVRLHGSLGHVAMWSARELGVVVVCCNVSQFHGCIVPWHSRRVSNNGSVSAVHLWRPAADILDGTLLPRDSLTLILAF